MQGLQPGIGLLCHAGGRSGQAAAQGGGRSPRPTSSQQPAVYLHFLIFEDWQAPLQQVLHLATDVPLG